MSMKCLWPNSHRVSCVALWPGPDFFFFWPKGNMFIVFERELWGAGQDLGWLGGESDALGEVDWLIDLAIPVGGRRPPTLLSFFQQEMSQ